mmetsp:Transcript_8579/g.9767  ORF Transcript_8579/g.9767 Transcript_8579/m.9767 type:complete len:143 (+) Transcript_8579:835-1263(+)
MSPKWQSINAITLAVKDMGLSVKFYTDLGLALTYGGKEADFSTLGLGGGDNTFHINLFKFRQIGNHETSSPDFTSWGRYIIYVNDVDAMHGLAKEKGYKPEMKPSDAPWGERYFHIRDPNGHEISFAKKIEGHQFWSTSKLS